MGIDPLAPQESVPGLLILGVLSLGYVLLLQRTARRRGAAFFVPGVLLGTALFSVLFATLQLSALAATGAAIRPAAAGLTIASGAAPGLAGSWLACRSIRKAHRSGREAHRGWSAARAFGAFWAGLVVTTLVAVVAVVALGQR